jgi:hypothetical protein
MSILTKGLIASLFFLVACHGPEQSEQERIRRQNAKGEFVYRHHADQQYALSIPKHREREKYPWEETQIGSHPRITKEYFRCHCNNVGRHSLPLSNGKERIYPILLDLFNFLQAKTGKKVIITCGHRCPPYNNATDSSILNQTSKHMIGAEADFYVQGYEEKPETILNLIFQFYKITPPYQGKKEYEEFLRYDKETNCSTAPWYNKEILIKLFKKDEGRDQDNQHPYPYLSIQVRHDRDTNTRVNYSWEQAFSGYLRY